MCCRSNHVSEAHSGARGAPTAFACEPLQQVVGVAGRGMAQLAPDGGKIAGSQIGEAGQTGRRLHVEKGPERPCRADGAKRRQIDLEHETPQRRRVQPMRMIRALP